MRYQPHHEALLTMLAVPIWRIRDQVPPWAAAVAPVAAAVQWFFQEAFLVLLVLAICASVIDWRLGVRAAKRRDEYDSVRAGFGRDAKIAGIAQLLLVWGLEWWAAEFTPLNTHGVVAIVFALGIFAAELESIDEQRRDGGGARWPIFSRILGWIHGMQDRLFPNGGGRG